MLSDDAEEKKDETSEQSPPENTGANEIRIVVVDDDVALLKLLEFHLTNEGYRVFTAQDGEAGLKLIFEVDPTLIILDLNMPKMRGAGVFAELRGSDGKQRIPVIVLTAMRDLDELYVDFGINAFLTKPVNIETLLSEVVIAITRKFTGTAAEPTLISYGEETREIIEAERQIRGKLKGKKGRSFKRRKDGQGQLSNKSLLIVENDVVQFNDIANAFRDYGFQIDVTANAKDVLDRLREGVPKAILIKLWLPDLRGDEVILRIKEDVRMMNVPIFLYTHLEDQELSQLTFKAIRKNVYEKCGLADIVETDDPRVLLEKVCLSGVKP